MTTPKAIQSISTHLLPRFSADLISNATDHGPKSVAEDRFILSSDDLNDPDKRGLFESGARQNLPWLHSNSELWKDEEHADVAFHASRELAASIDNWAKAAVNSAIVMSTITDLAQDPAIRTAMLPAMKAMAESGNKAVYSVLLAFAGNGLPDALEQAKIFVLANRVGVDTDRHGWMQHLGLILATRHLEKCAPVRVSSTTEMLEDPEANPVPLRIAQDLLEKFDDLKDMDGIVHEALREAHEYFEYFYNDDNDAAEMGRIKNILTGLASTKSRKLEPISDDDFRFLANSLTLPVPTMLMSIAYHGQANPSYFETLESFANRGSWEMFADDILQVFEV